MYSGKKYFDNFNQKLAKCINLHQKNKRIDHQPS